MNRKNKSYTNKMLKRMVSNRQKQHQTYQRENYDDYVESLKKQPNGNRVDKTTSPTERLRGRHLLYRKPLLENGLGMDYKTKMELIEIIDELENE